MPKPYKGYKFILCIIDEVTNYLITVPIYHSKSEDIGDALFWQIICSKGSISKIKAVAPYNHQSLQAKHRIKSLWTILTKHLTEQGYMWPKYLPLVTLAYNTFNSPKFRELQPI